jgi:uncharacterized membrane protein YgaE (UPF0421/DUF939 family)
MFIAIVLAVVAFVIGVFGFSQIFICLFFAIPTSFTLKRQGKVSKDMPVLKQYLPTIIF